MFPIFAIFSLFGKDALFVCMIIANVVYFISACLFVFAGVKRNDKEMVKVGVLMFGYQAMFKVIISGVEIPTKMIISIGIIALIVVSYIVDKRMGARNEK
jgi:putative flippase GtrA